MAWKLLNSTRLKILHIKVTDVAGNLIYQTTSNGGTATWSGKTLNGEQVATGVYLIWTAPNTGKGRKVGKVAIIR